MSRPLRVLLVGRHFWPHGSVDSGGYLVQLACGLSRRGISVEVCTPRYASSWPEKFWLREIPVHRPAMAPRSDWSIGRYTRQLTQWLRAQSGKFDVVMVDAIREESIAAIEASRLTGTPTVVRYAGWGRHADNQFWKSSRAARRCGTIGKMADAVIAKSGCCKRALIADRFADERIVRIESGFAAGPTTTIARRIEARRALAAANSDLKTHHDNVVAICNASMIREGGITDVVKATYRMVDRHPNLKVWFLGDGPHRDWIYDQLRGDGVRTSIAMPGSFANLDDVYSAADLYLQPDDTGLDHFLPMAVSMELPIVARASESVRAVLVGSLPPPTHVDTTVDDGPASWIKWIDDSSTTSYVESISSVLSDLPESRYRAGLLRRHGLRSRPTTSSIDACIVMFERTIARKSSVKRTPSSEVAS